VGANSLTMVGKLAGATFGSQSLHLFEELIQKPDDAWQLMHGEIVFSE